MADRYWGGGSGPMDGNWNTATNWTGDAVPGSGDNVIFDATDVTNCTVDAAINVNDFNIDAGYTGLIDNSVSNHNVTLNGNFDNTGASSNTINLGTGTYTLYGDWLAPVGFTYGGATLNFTGGNEHRVAFSNAVYFTGNCNAPSTETIAFYNSGAFGLGSIFNVNWDCRVRRISGSAVGINIAGNGNFTWGPNAVVETNTVSQFITIALHSTITNHIINQTDLRNIPTMYDRSRGSTIWEGTPSAWFPAFSGSTANSNGIRFKGTVNIGGNLVISNRCTVDNSTYNPDINVYGLLQVGSGEGNTIWTKGTGSITLTPGASGNIWCEGGILEDTEIIAGANTLTQSLVVGTGLMTYTSLKIISGTYDNAGYNLTTLGDFTIDPGSQWVGANLNGSTITIGGNMLVVGQSGNLINWAAGGAWNLVVNGSTATAVYVNVSNSTASGAGTPVTASACTNGGGNSGWTFGAIVNKYWVATAGVKIWTDTNNWSLTSGGAGGAGVPTAGEAAIFDGGSVVSCNVQGTVKCYSVYISGPENAVNGAYTGQFLLQQGWDFETVEDFTIGDSTGATLFTGTVTLGASTYNPHLIVGGNFYCASTTTTTLNTQYNTLVMKSPSGTLGMRSTTASGRSLYDLTIENGASITLTTQDSNSIDLLTRNLVVDGTLLSGITIDMPSSSNANTVGANGRIGGAGKFSTPNGITNNGLVDIATCELYGQSGGTHVIGGSGTFSSATAIQIGSTRAATARTYQFSGSLTFTEAVTFYAGFGGSGTTVTIDNSVNNPSFEFQKNVSDVFSGSPTFTWTKGTGSITLSTNSLSFGLRSTGALEAVAFDSSGNTFTLSQALSCQRVVHSAGTLDPNSKNITTVSDFNIYPNAQIIPTNMVNTTWTIGGNIDWDGASGNQLNLKVPSTPKWQLNVTGTSDVQYADVQNSDASGSTAPIGSEYMTNFDFGGNVNWTFFDDWRFWTGAGDGNWNSVGNWSSSDGGASTASVPDATKDVFFNGNGNVNCNVNVAVNVNSIDIGNTAYNQTINWNANNVTIAQDFIVGVHVNALSPAYFTGTGGTWNVSGNFKLFMRGDHITFTGNTLNLLGTSNELWVGQNIWLGPMFDNVNIPNGSDYELFGDSIGRGTVWLAASALTIGGTFRNNAISGDMTLIFRDGSYLYVQATANIQGYNATLTNGMNFRFDGANADSGIAQMAAGSTVNIQYMRLDSKNTAFKTTFAPGTYDMPIYIRYRHVFQLDAGAFTFNGDIIVQPTSNGGVYIMTIDCATNSPTVNLKGNFTIDRTTYSPGTDDVIWLAGGTLNINGTANQTISTDLDSGAFSNTVINNPGNAVDFTVGGGTFASIEHNAGTLDLNGTTVSTTGKFDINSPALIDTTGLAGSTINVGGNFTCDGVLGTLITLNPGSPWTLNVTGYASVSYTDAANSNASGGSWVDAGDGTNNDGGSNSQWEFTDDNRHWIASSPSNWNNTANWARVSGGFGGLSVPAAGKAVVFDSGGNGNCTVDAVVNIASLTYDPTNLYTGTLDFNDFGVTVVGDVTINDDNYQNQPFLFGNGSWSIGGHFYPRRNMSINYENSSITMTGASKNFHGAQDVTAPSMYDFTVANGASVSITGIGQPAYNFVTNSLTVDGTMSIDGSEYLRLGANSALTISATGAINQSGAGRVHFDANISVTKVGPMNCVLVIDGSQANFNAVTWEQGINVYAAITYGAGTHTFNGVVNYRFTNNQDLTSGAILDFKANMDAFAGANNSFLGGTIRFSGSGDHTAKLGDGGSSTTSAIVIAKSSSITLLSDFSGASLTVNSGTFDANDFSLAITGDVSLSGGTLLMKSGIWTVGGSFTRSAGTLDAGTSTLILNGSGNLTGLTFYDIDIQASGTYTLQTSALSGRNFDVSSGAFAPNNLSLNISGNFTVDSAATWTKGTGTITLTGAGSGTQTIDTNDKSLEDVVVNDAGATKQLLSTLRTESLTLTNGELDTNNMNIYITVGDLTVAATATYTRGIINSRVRFVGTGAQALTVDTADIIDVIHVEKPSGAFTFNTNANIEAFFANQGDININGKTITTLAAFFVDSLADFVPVAGLNGCTINVGGNVTFAGSAGNILDMKATVEWFLNVTGSSMASYVDVSWSNANGGQPIFVDTSTSIDSGDNKNWLFPVIITGAGGRPVPQMLSMIKKEFGFPR